MAEGEAITVRVAVPAGRAAATWQTGALRWSPHVSALLAMAALAVIARVVVNVPEGWLFVVGCGGVCIGIAAWRSPPIAATTQLFSWPLIGLVPAPIPLITLLGLWTLLCLFVVRRHTRTLKPLDSRQVILPVMLISGFMILGIVSAWVNGTWVHPLIRMNISSILTAWAAFFALGLLSIRSDRDFRVMMLYLPVAFLQLPLSFPLEVWWQFLQELVSGHIFSAGLRYGSLNPDTLGNAAALAATAAFAAVLTKRSAGRGFEMILFVIALTITLASGARQSLLSFTGAFVTMTLVAGARRALMGVLIVATVTYAGSRIMMRLLPDGSPLFDRMSELITPMDTWASNSASTRLLEFGETYESWLEAPWFGHGFGSQRYSELLGYQEPSAMGPDEWSAVAFLLRGTHNLFFGVLTQTGIVGAGLLLLFVITTLISHLRWTAAAARASDQALFIKTATFGALTALFIQQNISGGLGLGSAAVVFLVGAMAGASARPRREVLPAKRNRRLWWTPKTRQSSKLTSLSRGRGGQRRQNGDNRVRSSRRKCR